MTHQQQIQKQNTPAQASSKASVEAQNLKSYRIEASVTNPENAAERGNLHDYHVAIDRTKANGHARLNPFEFRAGLKPSAWAGTPPANVLIPLNSGLA